MKRRTSRLGLRNTRDAAQVLHYRTEEEMDAIPLEVSSAFVAIAAGGFLILAGYIIDKWRK